MTSGPMNFFCLSIVVFVVNIIVAHPAASAQFFRFGCSSDIGSFRISGLSADGRVLVGQNSNRDVVRWTPAEGLTVIGKPSGLQFSAHVTDISEDGETIMGYAQTALNMPEFGSFIWTRDTGFAVGQDEEVLAIAKGFYGDRCEERIKPLSGYDSVYISGESKDGKILVGSCGRQTPTGHDEVGFVWDADTGATIIRDDNGVVFRRAADISGDGTIIVGCADFPGEGMKAAIWKRNEPIRAVQRMLEDEGVELGTLSLYGAIRVSNDGNVIVAVGRDQHCSYETCVAYLGERSDLDLDGLPDDWECALFGGTGANATDDPDGDGMTNIQEFEKGTNPSVTDVTPFIIDLKCGTNVCISILATTNWLYTLQYCDDLRNGNWKDVDGQQRINGIDDEINLTDSSSTDHGYYRVVAEIKKMEPQE